MTRFDFDVIGDSPRLVSRPPDKAVNKAPAAAEQAPSHDHIQDRPAPAAKAQKPAA